MTRSGARANPQEDVTFRFRWLDGVSPGLVGLTAAMGALVRDRLPERVATHFDLDGAPNGWMDRTVAVLFMPVVALVLWAVIRVSYHLMPEERRRQTNEAGSRSSRR